MKPCSLTIAHQAMPQSLRELARVLGDAGALRLTGVYGGQRLRVPNKAAHGHAMRAGLGDAVFEALVAEYAGISMDVPKCDGFLRELRHEQVRQYREQGLTMDDIAGETGYSRRHVINILYGDSVDTKTIDMFESAPESHAGSANDPFGLAARRG